MQVQNVSNLSFLLTVIYVGVDTDKMKHSERLEITITLGLPRQAALTTIESRPV